MSKYKKLPENVAKFYISEILLGLEELHKRWVMFRDLKPENVVLDNEGHCLLADFGLAKEEVELNSVSHSFCGTIAYLAPEMLERTGHNLTIDWYMLGVLLYELLVGVPPYFSTDRDTLFDNIRNGALLIPKKLSQEVRSLLVSLLCRTNTKRLGANGV